MHTYGDVVEGTAVDDNGASKLAEEELETSIEASDAAEAEAEAEAESPIESELFVGGNSGPSVVVTPSSSDALSA